MFLAAEKNLLSIRHRSFDVVMVDDGADVIQFARIVAERAKENGTKWIVVDTISRISEMVHKVFDDEEQSKKKPNDFAPWKKVGDWLRRFINYLNNSVEGCNTLFLAHEVFDVAAGKSIPDCSGTDGKKVLQRDFNQIGHMRLIDLGRGLERLIQFDTAYDQRYMVKDHIGLSFEPVKPDMAAVYASIQKVKTGE
jgi:hypothetical protein